MISRDRYLPVPPEEQKSKLKGFWAWGPRIMKRLVMNGLRPGHRVMDIGSGSGRVTVPLTQFLHESGSYLGIDIDAKRISWCSRAIHDVYPNFNFHLLEVGNTHFKTLTSEPKKKMEISDLPKLENHSFDFIFAQSLFTHLPRAETEMYFSFIDRYLKEDGTFLSSWFLINEQSRKAIAANKKIRRFYLGNPGPDYYEHKDPSLLSHAIGFDEEFILALGRQNNLVLKKPVEYGGWSRENGGGGQDTIVFTRQQ